MKPLKFKPLLKQTIQGGDKVIPSKKLDEQLENIDESWGISGVEDNRTLASEGEYEGRALNDVVRELKDKLIGEANYERFGDEFPLLIKFIDTRQDLSTQVHLTDETVKKQGKSHDKTEMWYIMDSSKSAHPRGGLRKEITSEGHRQIAENDTILDAVTDYSVKGGDCFFLPAGRIHSADTGCFLAGIQQIPDVTYRIYDFKCKDKNGDYRELYTAQAAECTNYNVEKDYRTDYTSTKNQGVSLVHYPYFNAAVCDLDELITLDYSELDSFVILISVKGEGKTADSEGNETSLCIGETILIPVTTRELKVEGAMKFLETYV